MKMNFENKDVMTSFTNKTNFSFESGPMLFQMFSDMIYQHKIPACVRETLSNASDSHGEAGKQDTPVKVTLPNYNNPFFIVEDFGLGMNEAFFYDTFIRYNKSTKRDSDFSIGGFGVGAKSPYAYTDNFTVQIRKDGIECKFNCYIDENGEPATTKLYEKKTDEVDGVKVAIKVKSEDHNEFKEAAEWFMSFLPVPFTWSEHERISLKHPEAAGDIKEKGYHLGNGAYSYADPKVFVVMGGVPYEYGANSLYRHEAREFLIGKKVFIEVPMGSAKVALSRESLSLDSNTKEFIETKIEEVIKDLLKDYQQALDAIEHPVEKIRYMKNNKLGGVSGLFTVGNQTLREFHLNLFSRDIKFAKRNGWRVIRAKHNFTGTTASTVKKIPNILDFSDMDSVTIVYGDEKDAKGMDYYARIFVREEDPGLVMFDPKKPLTAHKRKRIEQFLGTEINWVYVGDLKAKYKSTSTNVRGPANKYDDHEVKGVSTLFVKGLEREQPSEMIDLSNDDETIVYQEKREFGNDFNAVKLHLVSKKLGLVVRVIKKTQMNEKKLEKARIPHVDEMFQQHREVILEEARYHVGRAAEYNQRTAKQVVRAFIDSDDDRLDHLLFEEDDTNRIGLSVYNARSILRREDPEFLTDIEHKNELVEEVVKDYPLINNMYSRYMYNIDVAVEHLTDYINMVYNAKHEINHMAHAA